MKTFYYCLAVMALCFSCEYAQAVAILTPGDPIIAIDLDPAASNSSYPDGEAPPLAFDGTLAKYLNFGGPGSGVIVTPTTASTIVDSFRLTTANDAEGRDPTSYEIWGINSPIVSADNSDGLAENWSLISSGGLNLPAARDTVGNTVDFTNSTAYNSYKFIFPENKGDGLFQIAEIELFDTSDTNIALNPSAALAVHIGPQSQYPAAESPAQAIDRDVNTKYLNFGIQNSGFIVTPSIGATTVESFQVSTANDFEDRDPASWQLFGTNEAIASQDNGQGDGENWTLIDSGTVELPVDRQVPGPIVPVNNTSGSFTSYRMVFPTIRGEGNSIQYSEVQLFSATEGTLTINRQTGEAVLTAEVDFSMESYELNSPTSQALDASAWTSISATNADPDDAWAETSDTSDSLAEEDAAGGADNGFTLSAGNSYNLGNIWRTIPTEFEDLVASFVNTDGLTLGIELEFTGPEIPIGDYSGNGSVGIEDWPMFKASYGSNNTGMNLLDSYLNGDLDGDFDSDLNDFNLFVAAAGGAAALFGTANVPEPSSWIILGGFVLAGLVLTRFRTAKVAAPAVASAVVVSVALCSTANAQTFTNVGGAPVAVSIPADQMDENVDSGPINFFDDDFLDDPGAIGPELFLLDYNDPDLTGGPYLQYAGLGPEPKTVFFDYGSTVSANWFAYSQRSGGDPTADRVGMFEFWFSNTPFNDVTPTTEPDSVVKILPTDARLRDSALRPYTLSGTQSGRYVAMRLTVSELSASQPTNNIGGHEFRLLDGPSDVVLEVDRNNGNMTLRNNLAGSESIEMKSYAIESPGAGLDASGFNGVGGDSGAFPLGNGTGNGWEIGGGSHFQRLTEGYFSNDSTLASGVSGLSLGAGYNELSLAEDLVFTWSNSFGDTFNGRVEYVGTAPSILPGDYNNDSMVTMADYTTWRDALGSSTVLPNDATPGMVGEDDYIRWKTNFDAANLASLNSGGTAVPELGTASIACMVVLLGLAVRQRRPS